MKYDISPRQTTYNGVKFRSRLEATWAAFFDLINFNWEYEPIDLNGWSPDFLISDKRSPLNYIYVEVKPFVFSEGKTSKDIDDIYSKISLSVKDGIVLLLGQFPFNGSNYRDEFLIGKMLTFGDRYNWYKIDDAVLSYQTKYNKKTNEYESINNKYDIRCRDGNYRYILTNEQSGDYHIKDVSVSDGKMLFSKAKNITRWVATNA